MWGYYKMMNAYTKSVDNETNVSKATGYENLAMAVVLQAIKDYKSAYRANGNCKSCQSIEKFLKDSWIGDFFTNLDLVSIARKVATTIDNDEDDTRIMMQPSGKFYIKTDKK